MRLSNMAKKKNSSQSGPSTPQPKSSLNSVALTNLLKPFRGKETGVFYVINDIKDPAGAVLKVESIPLDSEQGQLLVTSTVSNLLGNTFADYDMKHANNVLKGHALTKLPCDPVNPISVPTATEQRKSAGTKARPAFKEFMHAVSDEGVTPSVDFQQNVRIELPGDPEGGLPADWAETSKRVRAWLFRFYLERYGIRPEPGELRDAIEWLRSEAFVWGMGQPSGDAAVSTLDDDAVFVAVRKYCSELTRVGDQLVEWASKAFEALKEKAREAGADLKKWPERSSDLSNKLKKSEELLKNMGLAFDAEHTREGSIWTFERISEKLQVSTGARSAATADERTSDDDYMSA
jgi:hypothetical protein